MKHKQFLILGLALLAGLVFAQPTGPAPRRIQRTESIAMGNLIEVVPPQHPADAERITGKVVVRIVISTEGRVAEAKVLSGHPMLMSATLDAVKQWKFRPYILDNERVEVETTATVEYITDPPYVVTSKPYLGPPRKLRVSQGVSDGNLVHRVKPQYPQEAKANHVKGDVLLTVTIDKKGNVFDAKVIKGDPVLAEAAVEAVRQWKYRPYLLNSEPVEIETTILVRFH